MTGQCTEQSWDGLTLLCEEATCTGQLRITASENPERTGDFQTSRGENRKTKIDRQMEEEKTSKAEMRKQNKLENQQNGS